MRLGSAQANPARAKSVSRSDENPAVFISSSVVMPKWARIVPTIIDATTTLTNARVRRWTILPSSRGEARADSQDRQHNLSLGQGHAGRRPNAWPAGYCAGAGVLVTAGAAISLSINESTAAPGLWAL